MGNIAIYDPLERIGGGSFLELVDADFKELNQFVERTGKVGSMTITLKVKPNGERRVMIEGTHKVTRPVESQPAENYFIQPDGHLARRDPVQAEMAFKDLPENVQPIKESPNVG